MVGFYYLTRGKRLLFQKGRPRGAIREWEFDDETTTVSEIWRIAVEALGLGARRNEVITFLSRWGVTERSGIEFAKRAGIVVESDFGGYIASVAKASIKTLKFGKGRTVVEALADLAEPGLYFSSQKELKAAKESG